MRLIAEIESDHGGIAGITASEADPVGDPGGLGIAVRVPEAAVFGRGTCFGTVVVQNDAETFLARGGDDAVQNLERVEAVQITVDGPLRVAEGDVRRDGRGLHHLVGEGDADGVVAADVNGVQDGAEVLLLEAANHAVGGLKAAPVDAADTHRATLSVDDPTA